MIVEPFAESDAWVLLAIVYASNVGADPAQLARVIAAGDFINHAILTCAELEHGLRRLETARVVERRAGGYAPTALARRAYRATTTPRRAVMKELDDARKFLATPSTAGSTGGRRARPMRRQPSAMFRKQYRAAVEAYLQEARKHVRARRGDG